eukprot:5025773-Heterocapsa_arctica.AAC.1
MDLNVQYNRNVEEIDGINEDLKEVGWNQMDGDSDFEEEDTEFQCLDQEFLDSQEEHFGMFSQFQAKGKGKAGVWREGDNLDAQADAYMEPTDFLA